MTGRYVDMGPTESGGSNFVANVVLDYRGYDTLLETTVIFTAVMSIMVLWGVKRSKNAVRNNLLILMHTSIRGSSVVEFKKYLRKKG